MEFLLSHWTINAVILLIFAIILAYYYMTRNFNYWKERGVVFTPPVPFLGNFDEFLLGRKSVGVFLKYVYDHAPDEPYVGFFGFDKPMLLIRDPELIKHILIKDFDHFTDRYANAGAQDRLGTANLFIVKNPAWRYLRAKISPIYTSGRLKKMFELMLQVGEDLLTHMESLRMSESGRIIEVKELSERFTTDLIATTAFGLRANSLNNPDAEFRKYGKMVFEATLYRSIEQAATFFAPFMMTPFKFTIFPKRVRRFLRNAVWDVINDREKTGVKRHDLIDLLIELKNHDADNPDRSIFEFVADNLVAQAGVFFTAGFETSATPLNFGLYELAMNPKIQNRLRKEITDALEETGGKITYDMATSLPYLDMFLSETLRKYPPLPIVDRVAVSDYRVPGTNLVIEKGTPVYISLMGLHRDPKYHNNPEKFDPERFSEVNREASKKGWLAFGEGPHACIGLRIGLLESKLGFLELLPKYEFSPCEKTLIPMRLSKKGLMTSADGGIYLNVKKITK